jgi:hypothetical protein
MPGSPEHEPNHEWRIPPKPQSESDANPLVPLLREQRGEGERSHEEWVATIRRQLEAHIEKEKPYPVDPVAWMRDRLRASIVDLSLAQNPQTDLSRHEMPHARLMMAWDLTSYPYYKSAFTRDFVESCVKSDARHLGHSITLTANESRLLSAMAEAVGIPNPFGHLTQERKP